MPAATRYDGVNHQKMRQAAEAERRERKRSIVAAHNYYMGDQWRPLLSTDGVDHNICVNLCRQVVDRLVAFLFPEMPQLELREGQTTEAEKKLRRAWDEVGGTRLLTEMALSGALSGHVFSRVVKDGDGVRIVNLDPKLVLAWWQADDVARVLWYEIQYQAADGLRRQDIVRDGAQWKIVDWKHRQSGWERVGAEVTWNSLMGPIVDWKHLTTLHSFYGGAEVDKTAITLNDRVNSVASDMAKILHHHASPRTVATGTENITPVASGPDKMYQIKSEKARVYNLEMQSDLGASLEYVKLLERAFFAQSRVVRLSGDVTDMQRVTNLGIRALYIDQLAKNEDLRRRYERGIQEISMRMLYLMGEEVQRPAVHWPDPLPQDPLQTVEVVERERALGLISRESMANALGIDWAIEQERMLEGDGLVELLSMERLAQSPRFGVGGRVNRGNGDAA